MRKVINMPYSKTYTQKQRLEEEEFHKNMKRAKNKNIAIAILLNVLALLFTFFMIHFSFKTVPSIVKSLFGVD